MDVYKLLINPLGCLGRSLVCHLRSDVDGTSWAGREPLQHQCSGMETLSLIYDMNRWVNHVAALLVDENCGAGGSVKLAVSAAAEAAEEEAAEAAVAEAAAAAMTAWHLTSASEQR